VTSAKRRASQPARASIDIELLDRRWLASLRTVRAQCRRAALAALGGSSRAAGRRIALVIALADDRAVRRLNRDFRGSDRPTNVLSFPADSRATTPGAPRFAGDVVLARQTVAREARAQGKPFRDHLTHLVVHGTLHLLGYDHETDIQARLMESLEVRILEGLGISDPYR
jgi:probable rRNA maturation factor